MPVVMFDKDGNYRVLKLEEVRLAIWYDIYLDRRLTVRPSFSPCPLAQMTWTAPKITQNIRSLYCHSTQLKTLCISHDGVQR